MAQPIDKKWFSKTIKLVALRVPAPATNIFLNQFKHIKDQIFVNRPRVKTVVNDEQNECKTDTPIPQTSESSSSVVLQQVEDATMTTSRSIVSKSKLILLNESFTQLDFASLPPSLAELARKHDASIVSYDLNLDYSHYNTEQVLKELLPVGITVPTGFATTGHIAHVNLRNEHLPYKHLIGQVLLDKSTNIKTVFNKVKTIENQYRTFAGEVIAGSSNMFTRVKEHNAVFEFDFSEVYWNSRLQSEHARIVDLIKPSQVVMDMFCGIGPFAIPLAQKGVKVFANDLNPRSYYYLKHNMLLNKVQHNITPYNMDGREFAKMIAVKQLRGEVPSFDHVIMNLPASAAEFCDVFQNLYADARKEILSKIDVEQIPKKNLNDDITADCKQPLSPKSIAHTHSSILTRGQIRYPKVHCYCFIKDSQNPEGDAVALVSKYLNVSIKGQNGVHVHNVRNVAPSKEMMCVTFPLQESIVWGDDDPKAGNGTITNSEDQHQTKKAKLQ
jgi:tRNA (guanine37-N1)-methyltransferase